MELRIYKDLDEQCQTDRLKYSRIEYNTVYTYEMSNAKYVNIIKVASDFKSMYIGQQPLRC